MTLEVQRRHLESCHLHKLFLESILAAVIILLLLVVLESSMAFYNSSIGLQIASLRYLKQISATTLGASAYHIAYLVLFILDLRITSVALPRILGRLRIHRLHFSPLVLAGIKPAPRYNCLPDGVPITKLVRRSH